MKTYTSYLILFLIIGIISCTQSNPVDSKSDYSIVNSDKTESSSEDLVSLNGLINPELPDGYTVIPDEYIVVLKTKENIHRSPETKHSIATTLLEELDKKIDSHKLEKERILAKYDYVLNGFHAVLTQQELDSLLKDPDVLYIEPNVSGPAILGKRIENADFEEEMFISQTASWGYTRVNGHLLDGTGKKAWIIDTGIDLDHPDLNVDVGNSISYIAGESADDLFGHGSHVAGILAAKNNSIDVVGVAAGATVVSVKAADKNGESNSSLMISALNYAASKASTSDVVNMSLGWPTNNPLDQAARDLANSQIKLILSAGNDQTNVSNKSPARVNHQNIFTISGYKSNDAFAYPFSSGRYSNFGSGVDYSGPGNLIFSLDKNGGTTTYSGTSQAAPHIAGLLLMNGSANIDTDGTITGDVDGIPDVIAIARLPQPVLQYSVQGTNPQLSWNSIPTADTYKLYRKFETGSWVLVTTTTGTSFTDTVISHPNLQTASSPPFNFQDFYTYKVHAHTNSGDVSNPSNFRYFIYPYCSGPGCGS